MASKQPGIVLASSSPQRRRLLAEAGYQFQVVEPSPQAECGVCSRETPPEYVMRLAYQKAADVAQTLGLPIPRANAANPEAIPSSASSSLKPQVSSLSFPVILGCDTVAVCVGHVLGKPANAQHAREMLRMLSGREHQVYSGLCLWPTASGKPRAEVDTTTLRMDPLSEDQIEEYVASRLWEGKAGGFGYQDRHGWLKIVSGSESNVIGLPLELLARMLGEMFPLE